MFLQRNFIFSTPGNNLINVRAKEQIFKSTGISASKSLSGFEQHPGSRFTAPRGEGLCLESQGKVKGHRVTSDPLFESVVFVSLSLSLPD